MTVMLTQMENENIDFKLLNHKLKKYSISLSINHKNNIITRCKCYIQIFFDDDDNSIDTVDITEDIDALNEIIYSKDDVTLTLHDVKCHIEKIEKDQRANPKNYWFGNIDDHHCFFEGFISANIINWGS